jgi:hypothetical protein
LAQNSTIFAQSGGLPGWDNSMIPPGGTTNQRAAAMVDQIEKWGNQFRNAFISDLHGVMGWVGQRPGMGMPSAGVPGVTGQASLPPGVLANIPFLGNLMAGQKDFGIGPDVGNTQQKASDELTKLIAKLHQQNDLIGQGTVAIQVQTERTKLLDAGWTEVDLSTGILKDHLDALKTAAQSLTFGKLSTSLQDSIDKQRLLLSMVGATPDAINFAVQKAQLLKETLGLSADDAARLNAQLDYAQVLKVQTDQANQVADAWKSTANSIGDDFGSAFDEAGTSGKKFGGVMQDLAKNIEHSFVNSAGSVSSNAISNLLTGGQSGGLFGTPATPGQTPGFSNGAYHGSPGELIYQLLAGFGGSAMGGGFGGQNTIANPNNFTNPVNYAPDSATNGEFALGGAFPGGIHMFADGGVVSKATQFGFGGGGRGVMGEGGPEAVMPLSRGPGGQLGVVNHGGGGGRTTINNNVYHNQTVNAVDANSFRKSARQIESGYRNQAARSFGH